MDISKIANHIEEIVETKKKLEEARDCGLLTQDQIDKAINDLMKKYKLI